MLKLSNTYVRKGNVIYDENNIPIIKLKQNFIDFIIKPNSEALKYMNRYISINKNLIETINNDNNQLQLFN